MNTTNSDLMKAVRSGNLEVLKKLLDRNKISSGQPWVGGYSLLCRSIEYNHIEISKLLLKNGSRVNTINRINVNTPLHLAVQNGHLEIIQMLIDRGAYINVQNKIGWTPIIYAVVSEQEFIVEILLRNGASIYGLNNGMVYLDYTSKSLLKRMIKKVKDAGFSIQCSAHNMRNSKIIPKNRELFPTKVKIAMKQEMLNKKLHTAVREGKIEVVEEMLNKGSNINSLDKQNLTPLFCAVKKENELLVELLLNKGAKFSGNNHAVTPLHIAVDKNAVGITKILLKAGLSANLICDYYFREYSVTRAKILNASQITPLHIAAENGSCTIIELLCENGADVNSCSSQGYTPLHCAVSNNKQECIIMLLKYGAYVDAKNNVAETPLHIASKEGYLPVAELLLKHEAFINSKSLEGYTPLHKAVVHMREEMVKFLLRNNADVNCCANNKITPLFNTLRNMNTNIAILLLEHGANVNTQDQNGNTLLNLAVTRNWSSMVNEVLKYSPDKSNESNKKSLKIALNNCCNYNEMIVQSLLDYGFTFVSGDLNHNSLYHVVRKGYDDILKNLFKQIPCLLDEFKDVNPLHVAVKNNNFSTITILLDHGADINETDNLGKPAIYYAIRTSNVEMTDILMKYKANINKWPELLCLATSNACKEIVEILLKNKVNTEAFDEFGRTALHITALNEFKRFPSKNKADIAKLLLENGANVNAKERSCGLTTLHLACLSNHIKLIKVLLHYKANIECYTENMEYNNISAIQGLRISSNYRNNYNRLRNGQTPLHLAAKGGNYDVMYMLFKAGATSIIRCKDSKGSTALHVAAAESNVKIVRRLVHRGAVIDDKDNEGQTALHIACKFGKHENVKSLLKFGSDVNIKTFNNEAPIDLALAFFNNSARFSVDYGNEVPNWQARESLLQIIKLHLVKLKTAGFYMIKKNQHALRNFDGEWYKTNCERELTKLKTLKYKNRMSYYDVLTKNTNSFSRFLGKKTRRFFRPHYKYPIYGRIIEQKVTKATDRVALLNLSHGFFEKYLQLPYVCSEKIFSYLDNEDLKTITDLSTICQFEMEENV
ncbi:ankyrin-1-like [Episyrphus balteatus]|uniref:ankyrin-1-like n=1 Tax=Episyrphus balteatus TaxID=286459 RepID=UPI0024861C65|nr:ankyrin-1-like [Episyrphus balteatus]